MRVSVHLNRFAITRINEVNAYVSFKHFVSLFVGYESSGGLGTKRLSLGTNRLGTTCYVMMSVYRNQNGPALRNKIALNSLRCN